MSVYPYVDEATYIELRLDEDQKVIAGCLKRQFNFSSFPTPESHVETIAYWVRESIINRRVRAYLDRVRA